MVEPPRRHIRQLLKAEQATRRDGSEPHIEEVPTKRTHFGAIGRDLLDAHDKSRPNALLSAHAVGTSQQGT